MWSVHRYIYNAIPMCPRSLRTMRCFMHVYLHAHTTVDAGDICSWQTTVILIMEKPKDPNPHTRIKMAQVLGSPILYLWISVILNHNPNNHALSSIFSCVPDYWVWQVVAHQVKHQKSSRRWWEKNNLRKIVSSNCIADEQCFMHILVENLFNGVSPDWQKLTNNSEISICHMEDFI